MENRVRCFLSGFLTLSMTGYSPERFLNLCRAHGIALWDLKSAEDGYVFCVRLKALEKLEPLEKKAGVRLRIVKKSGLPVLLRRYRKRVGLSAGAGLFILLFYVLSLFLWDVKISGNLRYSTDTLMTFLASHQAAPGNLKPGIDCELLEEALLDEFPELTWASFHISGTCLLLEVKEAEVAGGHRQAAGNWYSGMEADRSPCNLVAAYPGTVEKIITRRGTPLVKAGDQVETGQVLISGELLIQDEGETELARHLVMAEGEVLAKTLHQVNVSLKRIHRARGYTGRQRPGLLIKWGKWSVCALLPAKSEEKWEYRIEYVPVFPDFSPLCPIYAGKISGREYVDYEAFYTEQGINAAADGIYQNIVKNLREKGVQILENDVRILEDESVCHIVGTLHAREPIAQVQMISD